MLTGYKDPLQFMPSTIVKDPLDPDYGGLGNWYSVVNGIQCTNEAVRTNLPQPDYDRIRQDPRRPAEYSYPVLDEQYFIELDVPTMQPEWETQLSGRIRDDQTATNNRRIVGKVPAVAHVTTSDAEWFLVKADPDGANLRVRIPRLDYVSPDIATMVVTQYDPATEVAALVTGLTPAGAISWPNDNSRWIGEFDVRGFNPTPITYDANTRYQVTFASGADAKTIDRKHIDPTLVSGDDALIIGVSYKFLQLTGVDSYSWRFRLLNEHEVSLDLFMALGRSEKSHIIVQRSIARARLSNIPDFGETRGDRNEHNVRTYRYEIDQFRHQNEKPTLQVSDLFEETVHILPLTNA